MKYKIIELDHIPYIGECLAVKTGSNKKKVLEGLEWILNVRHIKYNEENKLVCFLYKTSIGYEAVLIEEKIFVNKKRESKRNNNLFNL